MIALNFAHHFERYAASLVSILGWGRRIDHQQDYILKFALKMMDDITMMQVPGQYWLEAIPELQYLPGWLYAYLLSSEGLVRFSASSGGPLIAKQHRVIRKTSQKG